MQRLVSLNGTYEFYIQIESYEDSNNDWAFVIVVDSQTISYTRHDASGSSASDEKVSVSSTIIFQISAGQQVWVETPGLDSLIGTSAGVNSWFSGHLISVP